MRPKSSALTPPHDPHAGHLPPPGLQDVLNLDHDGVNSVVRPSASSSFTACPTGADRHIAINDTSTDANPKSGRRHPRSSPRRRPQLLGSATMPPRPRRRARS
ncbi:hypothetical protein BDA96_04G376100 [Sorghum bicolor]|uniref:Uncharacterized protein n=2 Tax=Sorghum bicolor TaxID=4558 RepID=A0A921UKL9_SORBI|nr:hypothetical protein BDA96_04G376100 [Sorghum bicolor]KXG31394.1 hypothetical protein SORBI_3004G350800 [Sorghum bicolor]